MKIYLAILFVITQLTAVYSQGGCVVYDGDRIEFQNTTINGTSVINPGTVNINYLIPTEEIERIAREIKEIRELKASTASQKLSNDEQARLLKQKEEEIRIARENMEKEKQTIAAEKQSLQQTRENFTAEFGKTKAEYESLRAENKNHSPANGPIEERIQELELQAEQIIKSTENCLVDDFELVPIQDKQTGKIVYGFSLEEIRKDPNYVMIDNYSEGLARVKRNNKFGFFDEEGKLVIDFKYDFAESFKNGIALVKNVGKWFLIDKDQQVLLAFGEKTVKVQSLSSEAKTYQCEDDKGVYLTDNKGSVKSDHYKEIKPFNKYGYAVVYKIYGEYGLIDAYGNLIVPCVYDDDFEFMDDRFAKVRKWVDKHYQYGLFDVEKRKSILACDYLDIAVKENRSVTLEGLNKLFCMADSNYMPLTGCIYKEIYPFNKNQLAVVRDNNGQYGFADRAGKEVIPCKLMKLPKFSNGLAIAEMDGKGYGVINEQCQTILPFRYEHILDFDPYGLSVIKMKGKCGIANNKGSVIVKPLYDDIDLFDPHGYTNIRIETLHGLMDTTGKVVINPAYSGLIRHYEGTTYKLVSKGSGKSGLYDIASGKEIVECRYKEIKPVKFDIISCLSGSKGADLYYCHENNVQLVNFLSGNVDSFHFCDTFNELEKDLFEFKDNDLRFLFNSNTLKMIGGFSFKIENGIDKYGLLVFSSPYNAFLLDPSLNIIYQCKYIQPGDNGTYLVQREDSKYAFVNLKGQQLTEYIYYPGTGSFMNGSAIVTAIYGKKGVININGLEFIPPLFESIGRSGDDYLLTIQDQSFKVNSAGKCISSNCEAYDQLIKAYHQNK